MEVGRVCVKTAGHEAGRKCVIIDIIDKTHVLITGPDVKRRRCNIRHLEPLEQKLDLDKGASDEEVKHALELAGLVEIVKARERPPEAKESAA
jgi:large subunit ribosomal protein L14e